MEEDAFSTVSSSNPNSNGETNTETSGSSNCLLRPRKRLRRCQNANFADAASSKYKGVVQQQNGHWGAQIYANHKRVWLGTFKSEEAAAMAYDSASIKLRSGNSNSHRNFPWTSLTIHEPDFQESHNAETILSMIRDGSYRPKFQDYLRITRSKTRAGMTLKKDREDEDGKYFSCSQLFRKELTPSDVGKLNRLVIPKKYAVKYLPYISESEQENNGVKGVELVFYDKLMRQWKFRYCYWRSSQSFVLTTGWNHYVKEKNLKEKDIIAFYSCEDPNRGKRFLMIDVNQFGDNQENLDLELKLGQILGFEVDGRKKELQEEIIPEARHDTVKNKGFMLFGVRIE